MPLSWLLLSFLRNTRNSACISPKYKARAPACLAHKQLAVVAQICKRRQASQPGWHHAVELVVRKVPAQHNTACFSPKCKLLPLALHTSKWSHKDLSAVRLPNEAGKLLLSWLVLRILRNTTPVPRASVQRAKPHPLAARKPLAVVAPKLKRRQTSQRGRQTAAELVVVHAPAQHNNACVSPKCTAAPARLPCTQAARGDRTIRLAPSGCPTRKANCR